MVIEDGSYLFFSIGSSFLLSLLSKIISSARMAPSNGTTVFCSTCNLEQPVPCQSIDVNTL
jgi:hypothetical protein